MTPKLNTKDCFLCFAILFVLLNNVFCENKFKSIPVTVKCFENDTVLLPCYLHDTEPAVRVRWYKEHELLRDSLEPHHFQPGKVRMWSNYSLEVIDLRSSDTGDYTCEVTRPEPWGPIKQVHSIEVQHAPVVRTVPEDGFVEVKKGDFVDIACEVSGTPTPIVDWRKNGEPMALIDHRTRIRFKAEDRHLSGMYNCVANNGVGDPVIATIQVLIQDAPVVSAVQSYVHTALDLRAVLAATLEFATPAARTYWYKEGKPVRTDDRVIIMVQENTHQLIFRKVRKTDLGNYTFRAENRLGMADVSFRLTGVPNVASFKVHPSLNKATATGYTLIWEVDSFTTIIEYNLWLRPYIGKMGSSESEGFTTEPSPNLWSKIVVPGDSTEGPIHSASYKVRGLTPSTVYEAIVTSRNKFGWSKTSPVLHFATESAAYQSKTTVYEEKFTPTLEELETSPTNSSQIQLPDDIVEYNGGGIHGRHSSTAIVISFTAAILVSLNG